MSNEIIFISPGWWKVGATIIAGLLTAFSTFGAVIYTNNRTKKQLKEQADNFEKVRKDEFKQSKYVLIKVSLILQTFSNILERLIVNNDYNRILLIFLERQVERKNRSRKCYFVHYQKFLPLHSCGKVSIRRRGDIVVFPPI